MLAHEDSARNHDRGRASTDWSQEQRLIIITGYSFGSAVLMRGKSMTYRRASFSNRGLRSRKNQSSWRQVRDLRRVPL